MIRKGIPLLMDLLHRRSLRFEQVLAPLMGLSPKRGASNRYYPPDGSTPREELMIRTGTGPPDGSISNTRSFEQVLPP